MKIDCGDFQKFVDAYLDGEYDERERRDFDAHLAGCPDCRGWYDQRRWLGQAIRDQLVAQSPPMPGGCRAAVRARIEIEAAPARRRRRLALALPLPLVAAVSAVFIFFGTSGFAPPIIEEAVSQHLDDLPVEVPTPDSGELDRWFTDKLAFRIEAPRFRNKQAMLLGGRLSRVRGGHGIQRAAHLVYGVGAHKITVLVLAYDGEDLARAGKVHDIKGHAVAMHDQAGLRVARYHHHGLSYVVTSDLSSDQVTALIATAF